LAFKEKLQEIPVYPVFGWEYHGFPVDFSPTDPVIKAMLVAFSIPSHVLMFRDAVLAQVVDHCAGQKRISSDVALQ
jgi:hypothetical protein